MKAILYARVATEESVDLINTQLNACKHYAVSNGMEIVAQFSEIATGVTSNRVQLNKAIAMVNSGEANVIVCDEVSRIARSLKTLDEVRRKFNKKTDYFHFANAGIANTLDEGILLSNVKSLILEKERENIIKRTQRGILRKLGLGEIILSNPPYGYKKEGKVIAKVEDELSNVKRIFELAVMGKSKVNIVQELNTNSIPYRDGKKWSNQAVSRIIENSLYAGIYYYGRTYRFTDEKGCGRRVQLNDKNKWIQVDAGHLKCIDLEMFNTANLNLSTGRNFA